jgi:ketosteroid isomerase-like protein
MAPSDTSIEHHLKQLNKQWIEALLNHDTITLDLTMADDCNFTYPLEGDGKEQFIADIQSGELVVESMTRDNVEVRIHGHTAVLTGLDTTVWQYKGRRIEGYYRTIHVYAERDGVWAIVSIQACPISH